jgi:ABC-type oligopeptide transport system ATPase subunit
VLTLDRASKIYRVGTFGRTELRAVQDVTFGIAPGEVVSLIGESGSGKTTVGRMILRLIDISSGRIQLDGTDITSLQGPRSEGVLQEGPGIFQDPFSSYNPIFKADHVFGMIRGVYFAGLHEHGVGVPASRQSLQGVGLNAGPGAAQVSASAERRPAAAPARWPAPCIVDIRLLVADEIISMLDASTRIDVLNLLGDLKARGLGILFITHDLSLGYYSSQRTVILRPGPDRRDGHHDRSVRAASASIHPDAHRVGPAAAQEVETRRG